MKLAALLIACAACGRIGFDEVGDGGGDIVNAVVPRWQSGTRLRARVVDFGDGNRVLLGWYDSELATECQVTLLASGEKRCLPSSLSSLFFDAGCTMPFAGWFDTGGAPLMDLVLDNHAPTPCATENHIYPRGSEITPPTSYYMYSNGVCSGPLAPPTSLHAYTLGAELDGSGYAHVVDSRVGTQRLQAAGWISDDGANEYRVLFDTTLQTPCTVNDTADGQHCLPSAEQVNYYGDAACTVPLTHAACEPAYVNSFEDPCSPVRTFHKGDAWSGPVYGKFGAGCMPASVPNQIWSLGAELDPTETVRGDVLESPPSGRLAEVAWHGSDGTRQLEQWRDVLRNELCNLGSGTNIGYRCLPSKLAVSRGDYSNASCTVPIGEVFPACGAPDYVLAIDIRAVTMHAVDPAAPAPTARYQYLSSCALGGFDASKTYAVGVATSLGFDVFTLGTVVTE